MTTLDFTDTSRLVLPAEGGALPRSVNSIDSETTSTNGCTDGRQLPTYIMQASFGGTLNWTLRDEQGNPVTPSDADAALGVNLTSNYDRMALFHNPFCNRKIYGGRIERTAEGLRIHPPTDIVTATGLYQVEVHWRDGAVNSSTERHYLNSAYLSVEQTVAQRVNGGPVKGPLPLSRIRSRLRDFVSVNNLPQPEYSVEEIVLSMLEPVEFYNETLPHISTFTVDNFPYRQQWLDATVARLLQITGNFMARNHVAIDATAIGGDDRAQFPVMMREGQRLWDEYKLFVSKEKISKNFMRGFRIVR